jgi:hypothetical protein
VPVRARCSPASHLCSSIHGKTSVEINHRDSIGQDTDSAFVCIGPDYISRQYKAADPQRCHEELCRTAFREHPVVGSGEGSVAQRALMDGGTLDNGKLFIREQGTHGRSFRHLIAGVAFPPNCGVTCYGGS